jgi:hypothetical protein
MPPHVIHEHASSFEERSSFLLLVLGLLAASGKLERLGAQTTRRPAVSVRPATPDDRDDGFVHLVLGLVSLAQRLRAAAEAARRERAAPVHRPEARREAVPRDLLV